MKTKKKKTSSKKMSKRHARKGRASKSKESVSWYVVSPAQVTPRKILASISIAPYFHKDDFVLYLGDSLKIMGDLPENSIGMIFADPPYNLSNGGFTVHAGRRVSVNKGDWDKSKGLKKDFEFHL